MTTATQGRSSSQRSQQRSRTQGKSTEPSTGLPTEVRPPSQQNVAETGETVWQVVSTPSHALYFGGLAALAAFSVIEWPVAAAIGVGAIVASSNRSGTAIASRVSSR